MGCWLLCTLLLILYMVGGLSLAISFLLPFVIICWVVVLWWFRGLGLVVVWWWFGGGWCGCFIPYSMHRLQGLPVGAD